MLMLAQYDTQNMAALRRLVGAGVQLRSFPRDVMEAAFKAADAYYREEAARNAEFRRIYEPWTRFRDEIQQWFRIAELNYDVFAHTQKR
jgi:TRAP-type mannitol/chloroaromatic compound transport system substrate-binding protein